MCVVPPGTSKAPAFILQAQSRALHLFAAGIFKINVCGVFKLIFWV